jgi:hypothetical protein
MNVAPIPKPDLLDPDRLLRHRGTQFTDDDRPRVELLDIALHESCGYAEQLWNDLNAMRQYLLNSLPPDPQQATHPSTAGAAPTGPEDEQGWQNWMDAFAAVTSVLCGPHGDSGFGLSRARQEAQRRRTSPPAAAPRAASAGGGPVAGSQEQPDPPSPTPRPAPTQDSMTPQLQDTTPRDHPVDQRTLARTAGIAVLIGLALRGLRPRHSGSRDVRHRFDAP